MKHLKWSVLLLVLFLTGCNTELYQDLPQDEANQMVALLRLHHISVSTETAQKSGRMTLKVDEKQFTNAVELLRQNGLPKPHYASIEDLFPSGQLVTSPAQEAAKMGFLKEQQLDRTLSSMDGVISARVSIAEPTTSTSGQTTQAKSASVYIKYSPQANLGNAENQIKNLVKNAVPGLSYDNISVFLQAASYRYQASDQAVSSSADSTGDAGSFVQKIQSVIDPYRTQISLGLLGLLLLSLVLVWSIKRRAA